MDTKTTYHRDGTVTLWDVYDQMWHRMRAENVSSEILATLSAEEHGKVERHGYRAALRRNGYDKHRILADGDILVRGLMPGTIVKGWYLYGRLGDTSTASSLGI